ncbi:MAG: formylglycine-generating enzyme family protein [Pseudomonadota bacterium]
MKKTALVLSLCAVGLGAVALSVHHSGRAAGWQDDACGGAPEMVLVQGGTFTMGAGAVYPEESPAVVTEVGSFLMSRYEVTNAEFAAFAQATGYVTVAERPLDQKLYPEVPTDMLQPGSAVFVGDGEQRNGPGGLWQYRVGANWRQPAGPGSSIAGRSDYPVVHIALEDAIAYAEWKGERLPTEAEFEYASRGGLDGERYATGRTLTKDGSYVANTWQGFFPTQNSQDDGFAGLAPVGCYGANPYLLHDLIGNVWERTSTPYYPRHFTDRTRPANLPLRGYDPRQPNVPVGVIKGGSYLCAENLCMRYRPAARHAQETGLGTNHIGFRTVKSVD